MAENSALDTLEMAQEWVKGGIVEGIAITIDEYMAGQGIVGEVAIQAEIDKITQAATKQATDAVEIDPTLVSTSGNTNAASLKVTIAPEPELPAPEPEEPGLIEGEVTQERVPGLAAAIRVTKVIANPNYDPTDPTSEELITVEGIYNSGPDGTAMTGSILSGQHVLQNDPGYTYDPSQYTPPPATTTDAPQLGALPQFANQGEIDQDRYDSTSAAGKALAAGESLPSFSLATSPSTMKFFNNQTEMSMPTLRNLSGMTSSEIANWNPFARMTQKPEFNDLVSITQDRWGGRRTAPAATMGGFTQASSIMPSRAPRSTRSASATNQTPFGFKAQGRSGAARTSFNRPSRLKAASIRSGRDGMIRGRGA